MGTFDLQPAQKCALCRSPERYGMDPNNQKESAMQAESSPAVTPLEESLRRAHEDPEARPAFYRMLLESTVFVRGNLPPDGNREQVQIMRWPGEDGEMMLPMFSSMEEIGQAFEEGASCLGMTVRELFRMCGDGRTIFILYPDSPLPKYFVPGEVAHVLQEDNGGVPPSRDMGGANVQLGVPDQPPQAMLDALSAFFTRHDKVKAAYLALMHNPGHDPQPTLVIGVDLPASHMERLMREITPVIAEHGPANAPVDMLRVEAGNSIADFMLTETKPFYERRQPERVGFFKSLFGGGR